jgi:diguanylate cyclase (GGDEF)-like protein
MDAQTLEQERLAALDSYDVLDTPREEAFDRITRLVQRLLDVPIAAVSLIDGHRQWFKSKLGFEVPESPRASALCSSAIGQLHPVIVPDTLADPRYAQNPHVVGPPHIRFYAGVQLRTDKGHSLGVLCAMDTRPRVLDRDQIELLGDLARIVMSELELRILSTNDSLTGALSRRGFRDQAGRALALALRHGHVLSCIVCDIDHLTRVNGTFGPAVGDVVLNATVDTLKANLRSSDLLGRSGGEEFAILLPQTGAAAAMGVAEKLRGAVGRLSVPTPTSTATITASFGVATFDRSITDIDMLLERAKTGLLAAKQGGRNRCIAWQPAVRATPIDARRRVLKAGRMLFNGGRSSIDCTVRSLSNTGASLAISSSAGVPDQFKLQIEADNFSRMCRIVTKADRQLEVAFD